MITLSSVPPRFGQLGYALRSLAGQRSRPEAVELYIPRTYRRFPAWGGGLPDLPDGIRLVRVDNDLGPATKILPAVAAYRGQAVEVIYADDDQHFARDWAEGFLAARRAHPEAAVCAAARQLIFAGSDDLDARPMPRAVLVARRRGRVGARLTELLAWSASALQGRYRPRLRPRHSGTVRPGYADLARGFGGVAVRPEFLGSACPIPERFWPVDDIWISGTLARNGIPIWADTALNRSQTMARVNRMVPLITAAIGGESRDELNAACANYMRLAYGIRGGQKASST